MRSTKRPLFLLLALLCWLSVYTLADDNATLTADGEVIEIPIACYILDSDDDDDALSSERTVDNVQNLLVQVNHTWSSQANITIDTVTIDRITVPKEILEGLGERDFGSFFRAINRGDIALGPRRRDALIWGFFLRSLGGPNGMKPSGVNSFFVVDDPNVHDYRVTSHEIGHILRLHHATEDPARLMYSGSNGLILTDVERVVARYAAEGMMGFFNVNR